MWLLLAFLSALFAALVAIFGKLGLKSIDSTLATTIRSVIMAVFLLGVSVGLKKFHGFSPNVFTHRDWLFLVLAGLSGALSWLCYFGALKIGLADRVVAIDRLSIVLVVILAALFLGEPLQWKGGFGALLMVIGAVLLATA